MPPVNRNKPVRAKSSESQCSLVEFMRAYPDDATCLEWLWLNRYSPDGEHAECPKCETMRVFKRYGTAQTRQSWTCTGCGHHLHPTAGTIYHKSSTSLHLWFYAMYLMTSTRCGISAKQLERELGVNYKTAARMARLIRVQLMADDGSPLSGTVEMDETFIGGKEKNKHAAKRLHLGRGGIGKQTVFGMAQRKGKIVAIAVPSNRAVTLMPQVATRVMPASQVFTDELKSYNGLHKAGYYHRRVNHTAGVYVDGDAHVNTVEGFWSLVKRGIGGVYHSVSATHLQGYLNEYTWRYNHRDDSLSQFETLLLRSIGS